MTWIGAPADHKENMYKNEFLRKKKVGGRRQKDSVRRKRKYQSSVKPFYLKRWSNWMKNLIKTKICYHHEITMMVSPFFYFLDDFLLSLSLAVIGIASTVIFPSSVSLSTTFLNHSSM
jgi:hypothetical protein